MHSYWSVRDRRIKIESKPAARRHLETMLRIARRLETYRSYSSRLRADLQQLIGEQAYRSPSSAARSARRSARDCTAPSVLASV